MTTATINSSNLSCRTLRAIARYGTAVCVEAHRASLAGRGSAAISDSFPDVLKTRASAQAAIEAGREIETGAQTCDAVKILGNLRIGNHTDRRDTLGNFLRRRMPDRVVLTKTAHTDIWFVQIRYAMWTTFSAYFDRHQVEELFSLLPADIAVERR